MTVGRRAAPVPLPERWDGTAEDKKRVLAEIAAVLRAVARSLGLRVGTKGGGDCEVDSQAFGPALGGEVRLHADRFHLWVNAGSGHEWEPPRGERGGRAEGYVIARRTAHRRDFTGAGDNIELPWELLWDPQKLAEVLRLEGLGEGAPSLDSSNKLLDTT